MSGVSAKQGYVDGDGDFDYDDGFYMRKCVKIARKAIVCTKSQPLGFLVLKLREVKEVFLVLKNFISDGRGMTFWVFALRDAGDSAENEIATPPCTEDLIKAKVKRVVIGIDPNPLVASKGVKKLRYAGVEVTIGIEEELCKSLNEPFVHLMLTGKSFITLSQWPDFRPALRRIYKVHRLLLEEYDVVIVSSASITDKLLIPQSQDPGANDPSGSLQQVIVFSNQEIVEPKLIERETVVLDQINLNARS
ncbi:hypothetical protein F8388_001667 [Cannabis sativa]|uniref:Uncharacterized protein n=1 Tax=Cannabis sativa TaxID=3483 RepID=A0A7J6HL85_CANSA|nr:hypothetical protein F8388_001667 [Cannabis sativa]